MKVYERKTPNFRTYLAALELISMNYESSQLLSTSKVTMLQHDVPCPS